VGSETKPETQRERLPRSATVARRSWGRTASALLELREDTAGVFFRTAPVASRRRSASRALSSVIHSTVSPLATHGLSEAEGKLYTTVRGLYGDELTLVRKPIVDPFNFLYLVKSGEKPKPRGRPSSFARIQAIIFYLCGPYMR